jgi:DNA-binding CsgD family transcriptional regulator
MVTNELQLPSGTSARSVRATSTMRAATDRQDPRPVAHTPRPDVRVPHRPETWGGPDPQQEGSSVGHGPIVSGDWAPRIPHQRHLPALPLPSVRRPARIVSASGGSGPARPVRSCDTAGVLIGRDREAGQLRACLGGHHGIAVVTGPAGIGKTAVLREVIEPDALWVHGLATAQTRSGDALRLAIPSVSGSPERDASQLLRQLGRRRLVLDDAHWIDPYSLTVVELAATATRAVATWRTDDPSASSTTPAHWDHVRLGPLAAADARTLACHLTSTLTADELEQVLEVADGSPLLIQELATGPTLAPSAASALLGRVRGLSDAGRAAVVLVAAAEGGLDETLVDRAAQDELRRSGLAVLVHGRWWLRHDLLQESILEVVGPTAVIDAHRSLAALLAPSDPAGAARHAGRAGDCAVAVRLAKQVVDATEAPIEKARSNLALADLLETECPQDAWPLRVAATSELRAQGAFHEVVAALEGRALPSTDRELCGMAHVNLGGAWWVLGDPQQAFEHAELGLDLVRGTGGEAELLLHAGLAMYLARIRFDGATALIHARTALDIALALDQHVIFARTRIAAALLALGDPGWREEIDTAIADAVAADDAVGERLARESRHVHAFVTGSLDTALTDLRLLTERADAADLAPGLRALRLLLELLALGDRQAIIEGAEHLLAEEPIFPQRALAVAAGAVAAVDHGRADLAHRLLDHDEPSDPEEAIVTRWARAELAWAAGRPPSSVVRIDPATPILVIHPATTMQAVIAAWCALEAGEEISAGPVATLPGFAAAIIEVQALHLLAQGEDRAATEQLDHAAEQWQTGSDRRGVLRCRWGAALAADHAGAADAIDRLEACWSESTRLGSAPIATRAARALRSHGVHKPPFPTTAAAPLSGPQTQTLRLLATGFTTQQVATLLGLQTGTVDDHLHQSQDRLGLRTRAAALRWVGDHP